MAKKKRRHPRIVVQDHECLIKRDPYDGSVLEVDASEASSVQILLKYISHLRGLVRRAPLVDGWDPTTGEEVRCPLCDSGWHPNEFALKHEEGCEWEKLQSAPEDGRFTFKDLQVPAGSK